MLSLLVRLKYQQKEKSVGVKTETAKRSAGDDIKMGVVPVGRSGRVVFWGSGGFKVRCCVRASSLESECTFGFCPSCDMEVTSEVNKFMGVVGGGRRGRPKRSKSGAGNMEICATHETDGVVGCVMENTLRWTCLQSTTSSTPEAIWQRRSVKERRR